MKKRTVVGQYIRARDHLFLNLKDNTSKGSCVTCWGTLEGRKRVYCSEECADIAHSLTWRSIRSRILRESGGRCADCGGKAVTVHHIVPMMRGGTSYDDNLVPVCDFCHGRRHKRLGIYKEISQLRMGIHPDQLRRTNHSILEYINM